jgi:transcription initiation factor TFIIE subunit alpha
MAAQRLAGVLDEDGLKVATGAGKAQEVEIQMLDDEDEDERKKLMQKKAEEKRRQNVLPAWHTNSTISGEKTALGVKAAEMSNNNAILDRLDAQSKAEAAKAQSMDTEGLPTFPVAVSEIR